ncbi:ferredoxin [Frankia sp. Cppng1_Ct_nod]|uniref:ferredoxin n=1 Tax=Frankia sp. Cppng1_Ct_nod TaxID=2897162 RepID=UPI0010415B0F|nr:ferredoxin [Frankia sp. Cppng1_Ct_nod]
MSVWVDHKLCQGSELCIELAGSVFATDEEYVSYVKLAQKDQPADCEARTVEVTDEQAESVRQAAFECPSKCINII